MRANAGENFFFNFAGRSDIPLRSRARELELARGAFHLVQQYASELIEETKRKNPAEPEFHQAVFEVAHSLMLALDRHLDEHAP